MRLRTDQAPSWQLVEQGPLEHVMSEEQLRWLLVIVRLEAPRDRRVGTQTGYRASPTSSVPLGLSLQATAVCDAYRDINRI